MPMWPAEWLRAKPLRAAAVLGLLAGVALGLSWPVTVPTSKQARAETWLSPPGLEDARPLESEFSAVRDAPIWGELADSGGVKHAAWQLAGIIADPEPAALVLAEGSTEAKRVRVGESLPDGAVVRQIMNSSVGYDREGCAYQRLLYGPGEAADNSSCDPGAKPVK